MGGEPLITPPGFHFFVSILILLAGMPLLFAQLITAAFFSSFIVIPAYLISRRIWRNYSEGLLAAVFSAISALSLEMISWGGYTNVLSLVLIVLIFYLFLRYLDQPNRFYLLMGILFFGSLIITHTFTLFVFFPILILYFVLLLIGKCQKIKEMKILDTLRFFLASVALGILAVLPWILRVLSFYIGASAEGVLLGGLEDNRNLILANRSVSPLILTLIIVLIPIFFMFKASRKKFVDSEGLLLVAWFLVPIILTQAYIFGIFTDYSRFMYFIDFPAVIIISAGLFYLFKYLSIAINKFSRIKWNQIKKTVSAIIFTTSIFIFIALSPWSIFPDEALEQQVKFYTTIQKPEATAMKWIQNRTPESAVLVADHFYGWWLSGIGKRTTLSAASLELLLYSHELEVAKSAQLLLDTNYYFDNGIIQVRDKGAYVSERDTEFSIKLWNGESFPIFNIKEEGLVFWYIIHTDGKEINGIRKVAEMETVGKPTIVKDENFATLIVQYEDELFSINRTLVIRRGVRFTEMSYDIEVKDFQTNLYNVWLTTYVGEGNMTHDESELWYGFYHENQICGQVIFKGDIPSQIEYIEKEPQRVETLFICPRQRRLNIKTLIGVFDAQDISWPEEVKEKYLEFLESHEKKETIAPLTVWEYMEMIEKYGISFVVCRDQQRYLKFSEDPNFRFILNNGNVAIFQVVR